MPTYRFGSAARITFALLASLAAPGSQADTYTYTGATTPNQAWNRPQDNDTQTPNALSSIGTKIPYTVAGFVVNASGTYRLLSMASGWDNAVMLYSSAFNPTQPLQNIVVANDDYNLVSGQSGFASLNLMAGTPYYLVTTGFGNFDYGSFSNIISGPGKIVPADLTLRIKLDGVSDFNTVASRLDPVQFLFRTPGTQTVLQTQSIVLIPSADGSSALCALTNLPMTSTDIAVKLPKSLQVVFQSVALTAPVVLPDTFLTGGDANGDNAIDTFDFGILVSTYGEVDGASGSTYDARADFNYDGRVDITDFAVLINGYGTAGMP